MAQVITQISTQWDDTFEDWIIYTTDKDLEGRISLGTRDQLIYWDYDLGQDVSGRIKQIWSGDSNAWELISYSGGNRIEMKSVWKNDFSIWDISQNGKTYRLTADGKNVKSHWTIDKSEDEEFHIYKYDDGNPRDWIIEDYIEAGSYDLTIAISMISIFFSL